MRIGEPSALPLGGRSSKSLFPLFPSSLRVPPLFPQSPITRAIVSLSIHRAGLEIGIEGAEGSRGGGSSDWEREGES